MTHKLESKHVIERSWYRPGFRTSLVLLFTLALDTLVIYFAYKLIVAGQYSSLVILILFPFLALVMTYYQIAFFLNKTTLEVQDQVLRVFAGPLPFYSPREYLRSEMKGIVVEEMTGKNAGKFNVKVVLASGQKRILLSLPNLEEAKLIESELQAALLRKDV